MSSLGTFTSFDLPDLRHKFYATGVIILLRRLCKLHFIGYVVVQVAIRKYYELVADTLLAVSITNPHNIYNMDEKMCTSALQYILHAIINYRTCVSLRVSYDQIYGTYIVNTTTVTLEDVVIGAGDTPHTQEPIGDGDNCTVIASISAAGDIVPPTIIYPEPTGRRNEEIDSAYPSNWTTIPSKTGFGNATIYQAWFKNWEKLTRYTYECDF